jgi:hypothetical protein
LVNLFVRIKKTIKKTLIQSRISPLLFIIKTNKKADLCFYRSSTFQQVSAKSAKKGALRLNGLTRLLPLNQAQEDLRKNVVSIDCCYRTVFVKSLLDSETKKTTPAALPEQIVVNMQSYLLKTKF